MAIFAILADKPNPSLAAQVAKVYPEAFKLADDSQWLVDTSGTAATVAEALGVRQGAFGRVVVLQASSVGSGYHARSLWDWLTAKAAVA